MKRTFSTGVLILAGLLLVQGALIALLWWPRAAAAPQGPLFPNLAADAIERITLTYQGDRLAIARSSEAVTGWALPEAGNYPVFDVNVSRLISDVVALDTSRLVANTPSAHARLGVDEADPVRRVDIALSSGVTETLFIGTSPNARATHVRRGGSDAVYLASDLDTTDVRLDAAGWVDTSYLALDPARVRELTIENANGAFILARDAAGGWRLDGLAEGEQVISATVDSLVSSLASVPLLRPLGAEPQAAWGLDSPQATITFVTGPLTDTTGAEPETATLVLGARDPNDDSIAAKLSTSPWYVALSGVLVDPILQVGRDTLVLAPPTPVVLPITTPAAPITGTAPLTQTEAVTGAAAVTGTAVLTERAPLTESGAISDTGVLTEIGSLTGSEELTAAEPLTP